MKTYEIEPIHLLNIFLLVLNCLFIAMLVSACSAKNAGLNYASLAPVAAPAVPASSPSPPTPSDNAANSAAATRALAASDFIAAMLAP